MRGPECGYRQRSLCQGYKRRKHNVAEFSSENTGTALCASRCLSGALASGVGHLHTQVGSFHRNIASQKRCRRECVKPEESVIRNRSCEPRFADARALWAARPGASTAEARPSAASTSKQRGDTAPRSSLQPSVLSFLFILI